MKRFFASFLGLCLLLISCSIFTPTATPLPPPGPDPLKTAWEDRSIFKPGLVASEQNVLDELDGSTIYHIDFKIADDLYHLTGTEEVRYTNAETVPLNEVRFRLFPNILGGEMTISNLKVDGEAVIPNYKLEKSVMTVPFSSALEPNQSLIIQMEFAVTVPRTLESNYGVLAYAENVLALAHAYPMIMVYDDEGWNAEIPPEIGDVTYVDASFYIVRVNAPKDVVLVTSGREIGHYEVGRVQTL